MLAMFGHEGSANQTAGDGLSTFLGITSVEENDQQRLGEDAEALRHAPCPRKRRGESILAVS